MIPPAWLAELHRRWHAARGRRTSASSRAFGVGWSVLLESAGVTSAEDERTARREAETLEKSGTMRLKRHRSRRYLIERISLPLESEAWLRGLFGSADPLALKEEALREIATVRAAGHPLWPAEWSQLCDELAAAFRAGKSLRPFAWHRPEQLRFLLRTLHGLTARERHEVPVRTASAELGLESKSLERHRRGLEAGLARMFGRDIPFEALGLVTSESMVQLHGMLELCFSGGERQSVDALAAPYSLSFADLRRATEIRTPATRLLTVENSKTTFRQLAAADPAGGTLIAASSFPTPALVELLQKLPRELPHDHFGDTDPSGWLILQKLREVSPRPVRAFAMKWREAEDSPPLAARDRVLLEKLLEAPEMTDCRSELAAMMAAGRRGDFEQESLGPPDLVGWPFFSFMTPGPSAT